MPSLPDPSGSSLCTFFSDPVVSPPRTPLLSPTSFGMVGRPHSSPSFDALLPPRFPYLSVYLFPSGSLHAPRRVVGGTEGYRQYCTVYVFVSLLFLFFFCRHHGAPYTGLALSDTPFPRIAAVSLERAPLPAAVRLPLISTSRFSPGPPWLPRPHACCPPGRVFATPPLHQRTRAQPHL